MTSQYGAFIPIAYGTRRFAGSVFDNVANFGYEPFIPTRSNPLVCACSYCGRVGATHSNCLGCGAQVVA